MAEEKTAAPLRPPFKNRPIPPKPPQSKDKDALSQSQVSITSLLNGDSSPQPVLDTASSIPNTPLDSLPTIAGRTSEEIYLAGDDIPKFLKLDLDLDRLNRIHDLLWMAGRPLRARPLHRYKMEGMEMLHTQQMDLHLLKFSNKLIIKPLAEYMLDYKFWSDYICDDPQLHASASGFLLSFIWLLTTPLDLKLAHDLYLLPSFVTWHWWKEFVKDFVDNIDVVTLEHVNRRYQFGDLRLGRINSIYRTRFAWTHFVRGYLYGYNRYVVFFQRKFSWILIVFVFFSLVLAAMQVGASVEPLQSNKGFLKTCEVFVVFSMVSVGAVLGIVGVLFAFIFIYNMISAINHAKRKQRERAKMVEQKSGGKKNV